MPASHTADRPRRRWRALLLGLGLALASLEGVLQFASYIAWSRQRPTERPAGRVLLCLGDSLTFGLGAAPSEAYPVRLQQRLAEHGAAWSVVNGGIPGQSSADVLRRLPALLAELRPEVVLLLVGWNDMWARPALLSPDGLVEPGFPLRWRTARLVATLLVRDDELQTHASWPFLGAWHVRDQAFYFAPDGTAQLGHLAARWTVDGGVLHLVPEHGAPFDVRWRRGEDSIEFALFGWDRFQRARRGPPPTSFDGEEIDDMIHRRELDQALAALPPEGAVSARAKVAAALLAEGMAVRAAPLYAALEAVWERSHDPAAGAAVARWRLHAGRPAEAVAIARALTTTDPGHLDAWRVLVDACEPTGRAALAAELEARAAAQQSPWRRAELHLERGVVLAHSDAGGSMAAVCRARALGIGSDETIAALGRAVGRGADGDALLAAAAAVPLPPPEGAALVADVRRAAVDEDEVFAVLAGHLELAIDRIAARGARTVLLGYPFAMPRHEAVVRRLAAARGVPFVTLVGRFQRELDAVPRESLFCDPIHCTARGYALMAEELADRLADGLR